MFDLKRRRNFDLSGAIAKRLIGRLNRSVPADPYFVESGAPPEFFALRFPLDEFYLYDERDYDRIAVRLVEHALSEGFVSPFLEVAVAKVQPDRDVHVAVKGFRKTWPRQIASEGRVLDLRP